MNSEISKKYSYRRLVYQHDPLIGYRFVPNLYARITRHDNTFVICTNEQGFRDNRSFDKLDNDKLNILALGDSYLAGDGISNEERFMNLIADRFDLNVLNMGVPGSGTDQQLLIQERIANQWRYDILVVVPFLYNINRNLRSQMYILDWISKKQIDIRKPYFELLDGRLELQNVPVPIADEFYLEDGLSLQPGQQLRGFLRSNFPKPYGWLRELKDVYQTMGYRLNLLKEDHAYRDQSFGSWQLMRAILERMISNAGNKPVIIVPIPLPQHIRFGAKPHYLDRFRELTRSNVHLVDLLPELRSLPREQEKELYLPDGHFSPKANQLLANHLTPIFSKLIKHRPSSTEKAYAVATNGKSGRYILGISCYYHDSAAAIVRDGRMLAAAQEERFSRVKHDKSFPTNAITYCLEEARIEPSQLEAVVYYDHEHLTLERMIATQLYVGKKNKKQLANLLPNWVATKFNIWNQIREEVKYTGPLYRAIHHRSHAASAFYPSPFDEAAIVTVDGVGEWSTTTIGIGEGNQITILKEQRFPHSLGLLYSAFTAFCGFKVNSGEYKLMGLAPYGEPKFRETILDNLIEVKEDGSFKLNLHYFAFLEGQRMTNAYFEGLFDGPPRERESKITQRECDLAASIQKVTEEVMLRIAKHTHQITGKNQLVLAGGVALNCVANGRILKDGPFKDIWVQPAAGDAGCAAGAALGLWYGTWRNPRRVGATDQHDSCFGPAFSNHEVKSFLEFHNYRYHILTAEERAEVIARYLDQGNVIGHFSGRMEFGPRALGSRSILADPRNSEMQRVLNLKIKFRESFRPFAPVVLEERRGDYFDLHVPSPYMLLVAPVNDKIRFDVLEEKNGDILARLKQNRSSIPAVTHIDYSARIQSVSAERYPELYEILKAFERKTGCGVLVNTSFNVRGEPIICSPEDAYRCFMRTDMDVLVMNSYLLKKEEQREWKEQQDWRSVYELD